MPLPKGLLSLGALPVARRPRGYACLAAAPSVSVLGAVAHCFNYVSSRTSTPAPRVWLRRRLTLRVSRPERTPTDSAGNPASWQPDRASTPTSPPMPSADLWRSVAEGQHLFPCARSEDVPPSVFPLKSNLFFEVKSKISFVHQTFRVFISQSRLRPSIFPDENTFKLSPRTPIRKRECLRF